MSDYIKLLRIADLHDAHQVQSGRSKTSYRKLNIQADGKYERALERLDELLEREPSLARHLDRAHDWNDTRTGGMNGADKYLVPRIKYNRKWVYGKVDHSPFPTLAELKRQMLDEALSAPNATDVTTNDGHCGSSPSMIQLEKLRMRVRR